MTDLKTLFTRFEAAPSDLSMQIPLAEQLLAGNRPDMAMRALSMDGPGTPALRATQKALRAAAFDGTGATAQALPLYYELALSDEGMLEAAVPLGVHHTSKSDEAGAKRWFLAAMQAMGTPRTSVDVQQKHTAPHLALLDAFFRRHPWHADKAEMIKPLFDAALLEWDRTGARLSAPDPVFSSPTLGRHVAETVLTERWRAYEAGELAPPPLAQSYANDPKAELKGRRALMIVPYAFFARGGEPLESEVHFNLTRTAEEAGIIAEVLDTNSFSGLGRDEILALIIEKAARTPPELIFFAQATPLQVAAIWAGILKEVKQLTGAKLAINLFDPHEYFFTHQPWIFADVADTVISYPSNSPIIAPYREKGVWTEAAYYPWPTSQLAGAQEKRIDFFFAGRANPVRAAMIEAVEGIFSNNALHCSHAGGQRQRLSLQEHCELMRKSRYTINSSIEFTAEAPKGRPVEAVQCGVLLFEFGTYQCTETFLPYIHYVPVANLDQLRSFAELFRDQPHWRDRIAEEGRRFFAETYSGNAFWRRIFSSAGA